MDQSAIELTLALFNEHRQRTGHNCRDGSERAHLNVISCDVCLYLNKLMKRVEEVSCEPGPPKEATDVHG